MGDCSQLACPNDCSNHGACINGVCHCDTWWKGPYCGLRDRYKCSKVCAARCMLRVRPDQDEPALADRPGDRLAQCMTECMNSEECQQPNYEANGGSVPPFDTQAPSDAWGQQMHQLAKAARDRQQAYDATVNYGTGGGLASYYNRVR